MSAQVISLAEALERQPGDRSVERLSDGRRKGDHGNRASAAMRAAVIANLRNVLDLTGDVTVADKKREAEAAGVHPRTVTRWWAAELDAELNELRDETAADTGTCVASCIGRNHARGCRRGLRIAGLDGWLYKRIESGCALQLTPDEVAFFASHTTTREAIAAVRSSPTHRLRHYGESTLYHAYGNVSEPVRVGAKHGAKRQRANEATYPLSGSDTVNESWSIDEYDLKLKAIYRGVEVSPKLLVVRERLSGLPLSHLVLHRAADGNDTGVVLAAASIGYTVAHPYLDGDLCVGGVARYLHADQGGAFIQGAGAAAARRLGIGLAPIPSHQPQANGDHEVMHQFFGRRLRDGMGSARGWLDRTGDHDKRKDHGTVPFETVVDMVGGLFAEYIHTAYTSSDRAGMTRLEAYARAIDDGDVYTGHDLTAEDEAALATVVGERTYDPTRGVLWGKRYFLSRDLANKAKAGQKVQLRQLLDPNVLYAFDTRGRFLAIVEPRNDADAGDQHGLYADRAKREAFVERVADNRAGKSAANAVKAQNKVGEEQSRDRDENLAAQEHHAPENYGKTDTDAHEPVRATQRGRKPADPRDGADEREAANEELATRTAAARRRLRAAHTADQTSTTPNSIPHPTDNPDSEPGGDNDAD